jgi:diaminopimelate decarboxylase
MHHFEYRGGELYAEDVPVRELAERHGTPLYVYSAATLRRHFEAFDSAFEGQDRLTCYSVKANSNLGVLRLLGAMGAGMDIVSGGELHRALKAGIPAGRIVYSGVGKRPEEIEQALEAGILMFNVESVGELERIGRIASRMAARRTSPCASTPPWTPRPIPTSRPA